jgi:hypothetical protein
MHDDRVDIESLDDHDHDHWGARLLCGRVLVSALLL